MELNKVLAEIAINGVFEGMQDDAKTIVEALEEQPIHESSKLSLRALLLVSEEQYESVSVLLMPWCERNSNELDTPHAFLALASWRTGNLMQAKQLCQRLLKEGQDPTSHNMAKEILQQIGG